MGRMTDEFHEFISAPVTPVPRELSEQVLTVVRAKLDPDAWFVFSKLSLIHLTVGSLTLLACPQFGIGLGPGIGVMEFLMRFGHSVCMVGCGVIFLGTSAIVAGLMLTREELGTLRQHRSFQLAALALMSSGALICLGAPILTTYGALWAIGGLLGASSALEVCWMLRRPGFQASRR